MIAWLGKLFSSSGEVSFGRVGSMIALLFGCYWVTLIVRKSFSLPDFSGLVLFVGAPFAVSKGLDKGAEVVTALTKKNGNQ